MALSLALSLCLLAAGASAASATTWERAWGKGVNGGGVFGVCTVASSCLAGTTGALGGEFNAADGVATDGAGSVYVAEFTNRRIQKFDSAGSFQRAWGKNVDSVASGTSFETCTLPASCKAGDGGVLGGEFSGPSDVATDTAGNVYVADPVNHRIQKFGSSGSFVMAWGKDVDGSNMSADSEVCTVAADCKAGLAGGAGGELDYPNYVATDTAGNVYVAEAGNQRVQKFDSAGNFLRAWGKDVVTTGGTGFEICTNASLCQQGDGSGELGGEFGFPVGLAADSAGNVYVSDANNLRIQRFDSAGNFLRAWGRDVVSGGSTGFEVCTAPGSCKTGTFGQLGGEFNAPEAVATNSAGYVYTVESNNNRIQRFDSAGNFQRAWGKDVDSVAAGTGFEVCTAPANCQGGGQAGEGGEFVLPQDVSTDGAGNVYVAEPAFNRRIQKFVDPLPAPAAGPPAPTGERAAALKKCKKKKGKKARKKCKKKASKLPV